MLSRYSDTINTNLFINPNCEIMNYNEATMKDHAILYMRGKDRLDEISIDVIERLQDANCEQFKRIENIVTIQYVTGQPYDDVDEMTQDVRDFKRLQISTDHNNSPLFPGVQNLWFRAVHDFAHVITGQPFGYEGECLTYETQKMWYPKDTHWILFSEICMQAAYCVYFGHFPDKQKVVMPFRKDISYINANKVTKTGQTKVVSQGGGGWINQDPIRVLPKDGGVDLINSKGRVSILFPDFTFGTYEIYGSMMDDIERFDSREAAEDRVYEILEA